MTQAFRALAILTIFIGSIAQAQAKKKVPHNQKHVYKVSYYHKHSHDSSLHKIIVATREHHPMHYKATGEASWYGPGFHGHKTASGERFNQYAMTAAHKTLPLNSFVKVTNLVNKESAILKINDRGPYAKGRIIDLSFAAARFLGISGTGKVEVVALN